MRVGKQRPRQGNKGREVGKADVDREGQFFLPAHPLREKGFSMTQNRK